MDIVTMLSGGFLGFLGAVVVGLFCYLFYFMNESKHKYLLVINSYNEKGGKVTESRKARKEVHKELGSVYVLPDYEKTNRMYVPDVGTIHEYPIIGNMFRKVIVFLTYRDGAYAPMSDEIKHIEKVKVIKERDILDSKTGKPTGKKQYYVDYVDVETWIAKPAKTSLRQFHLYADSVVLENFKNEKSWWEKHGGIVLAMSMIVMTVILCIMMLVLTAENADKVVTLLPQAADQVAARTAELLAQQNVSTQSGVLPLIPTGN